MSGLAPRGSFDRSVQTADETDARSEAGVCPYYHQAVELTGKRWTGAVIQSLLGGPLRFSEIAQGVDQISDRLLSARLKELEANGIVVREVYGGAPVRVEYALTPKGRALEPAIAALQGWACEWLHPGEE